MFEAKLRYTGSSELSPVSKHTHAHTKSVGFVAASLPTKILIFTSWEESSWPICVPNVHHWSVSLWPREVEHTPEYTGKFLWETVVVGTQHFPKPTPLFCCSFALVYYFYCITHFGGWWEDSQRTQSRACHIKIIGCSLQIEETEAQRSSGQVKQWHKKTLESERWHTRAAAAQRLWAGVAVRRVEADVWPQPERH